MLPKFTFKGKLNPKEYSVPQLITIGLLVLSGVFFYLFSRIEEPFTFALSIVCIVAMGIYDLSLKYRRMADFLPEDLVLPFFLGGALLTILTSLPFWVILFFVPTNFLNKKDSH